MILLRNEPCVKLELIYNDSGWKDETGKPEAAAYILRLWVLRDGLSTVREIRLRTEEYLLMVKDYEQRKINSEGTK